MFAIEREGYKSPANMAIGRWRTPVRIRELLDAGLNLAGVDRVLELEDEVALARAGPTG